MEKQRNTRTSPEQEKPSSGRRLHGGAFVSVIGALFLTLFLEALDQTIVSTAMPRIASSLHGFDRYAWVITAYLLASTTMIPLVGKLSDQFGRKGFLILGTVLFLLGSGLSGASQTMDQLILFRALQGLGAGIGISLVVTVIGDIFPPQERAKWVAITGAVYGFSSLIGPTLGGWLAEHGPLLGNLVTDATRWRWVFYINLPIGMIALAALSISLPATISIRTNRYRGWMAVRRIDFAGAALAAAATTCLLLGLTWGSAGSYGWTSLQVIGILAAASILYLCFFVVERFVVEPILPLKLLRNQVFAAGSMLSLLQGMILLGLVIYLPFFLQGVLGASATSSGLLMTPFTLSSVAGAMIAGFTIARTKRYQLITIIGTLIMTIGAFLLTLMTPDTGLLTAVIFMVIAGIGLGTLFSIVTTAVQNSLPRSQLGVGTAAVRYLGQVGPTLGAAIVGTVVNNALVSGLAGRLPAKAMQQLTPEGLKLATNPQVLVNPAYRDTVVHAAEKMATAQIPAGPQHDQSAAPIIEQVHQVLAQVFDAVRLAEAAALQHGFVAMLIISVLAVLVAFFLKDLPMTPSADNETDASEAESESEAEVPVVI